LSYTRNGSAILSKPARPTPLLSLLTLIFCLLLFIGYAGRLPTP